MFIIYIGIQPIARLFNYLGINANIKFGILNVGLVFIYIWISLIGIKKIKLNYFYELFLLVMVIMIYLISYLYVKDYTPIFINDDGFINYLTGKKYFVNFFKNNIIFYIVFSIIGINIKELWRFINKEKIRRITKLIYLIIITLFIVISLNKQINLIEVIFQPDIDNGYYLFIGDTFLIISIMVYFLGKHKLIYALNSLVWMYKIGSRTSLVCYGIFLLMIIWYSFFNNRKELLKKTYLVGIVIILIAPFVGSMNKTLKLDNRMISMFSQNIEKDSSLNSRASMNEKNIKDLKNIWFLGRVFREFDISSNTGSYSHNIISYWIEFGVAPFILIIFLFIRLIPTIFKSLFSRCQYVIFISCMIIVFIPSVIFSRSYTYPYLWFVIFLGRNLELEMKK